MKWILGISTFLFAALCVVIYAATRLIVCNVADEHTQITALRLQASFETDYDRMQNFCLNFNSEETIIEIMKNDYDGISRYISDALEVMTSYKLLESSLADVSLVNDRIHYSTIFSDDTLDSIREQVGENTFQWIGLLSSEFTPEHSKTDVLTFAGTIVDQGEILGVVIFSIDSSTLQTEDEDAMNSFYFLADTDGGVFPLNCSDDDAAAIWQIWTDEGQDEDFHSGSYYIHSYYMSNLGVWLVAALDTKSVGQGMPHLQLLIWLCVLLVFCADCIFFFIVSRGMVQPLRRFSDTMQQIRHEHWRKLEKAPDLGGCREIREIGQEFTSMMTDIDSLNRQIFQSATDLYEMKVQKQTAELAYLRGQIDPHFLYNTLEAMRQMALAKGVPELAQMTMDMASIFRYSTKGSDVVALREELENTKAYIRIQQIRFQRKIDVVYFFSDDVLALPVIKMLLQPIVENSIFHGLEPKAEGGTLYLGARREEDLLIITVKDDGVGIPEEMQEELKAGLSSETVDTSKHVGILNTNARIRLQYGNRYGLTIESVELDGTTVILTIPALDTQT